MVGLQGFIENNVGKRFGDKYLLGSNVIYTRYCRATEPSLVEVAFVLPWITISDCFSEREIDDNIKFYEWLKGNFLPLVEKKVTQNALAKD